MSDPAAQATTDHLLECVAKIHEEAEITGLLPSRAILIFETLKNDGDAQIDFVVTQGVSLTDSIGMAHFVREACLADLLDVDDE
jgi:hypothetical protein